MEHPGEKHTGELSRILSEWDNPQQAVLPMFHYFMERDKYISPEALEHIGRLTGISQSDLLGIGTFYQYFSFHKEGRHTVRVCLATPCVFCGGKGLLETLQKELGVALDETTEDGIFTLKPAQCFGQCVDAPSLQIDADVYPKVTPEAIPEILSRYRHGQAKPQEAVPFGPPLANTPVVFSGLGESETLWISRYEGGGGYRALREILSARDPDRVIREIEISGLAGRGGGAFATSKKLQAVRKNPKPHYIVANADEGEPGNFKDR